MNPVTKENRIEIILKFWFGDLKENEIPSKEHRRAWWIKDDQYDKRIKNSFQSDLELAIKGDLEDWRLTPKGALALIILLDQFSRNIYRDTLYAFLQDHKAVQICSEGIEKGFDKELYPVERVFFYMPLMHSEDMEMQEKSVRYFHDLKELCTAPPVLAKMVSGTYDYALKHYEIVERFGRYPHRNVVLGRESTSEEVKFLAERGSSF